MRPDQARGGILDTLGGYATQVAARAYVPYSQRAEAVVLLLTDGTWIPGVRVENASFPVTLPMLLNAHSTAVALERTDVCGLVASRALAPIEQAYATSLWPDLQWISEAVGVVRSVDRLPVPGQVLEPFVGGTLGADGLLAARAMAARAWCPESNFPVGALLVTGQGSIPGCNVEHPEWIYTLCAERNVLGTALSYGISDWERLYLSCLHAPGATPCGACRQVLVEHRSSLPIHIDAGAVPPMEQTPQGLLPEYFGADSLRHAPEPS